MTPAGIVSSPLKIKAITVSQPHASLIASGEQWVENRTWWTDYRGLLAIHAGRGTQHLTREEIAERGLPTAALVAVANLVACVPLRPVQKKGYWDPLSRVGISVTELLNHQYTAGPWCFCLRGVFKLPEPIPCSGSTTLFKPHPTAIAALEEVFRKFLREKKD